MIEKRYLDLEGLKIYTSIILELLSKKADASSIAALVGDLDKIEGDYETIVDALLAEIERTKKIESSLTWGSLGEGEEK